MVDTYTSYVGREHLELPRTDPTATTDVIQKVSTCYGPPKCTYYVQGKYPRPANISYPLMIPRRYIGTINADKGHLIFGSYSLSTLRVARSTDVSSEAPAGRKVSGAEGQLSLSLASLQ